MRDNVFGLMLDFLMPLNKAPDTVNQFRQCVQRPRVHICAFMRARKERLEQRSRQRNVGNKV